MEKEQGEFGGLKSVALLIISYPQQGQINSEINFA